VLSSMQKQTQALVRITGLHLCIVNETRRETGISVFRIAIPDVMHLARQLDSVRAKSQDAVQGRTKLVYLFLRTHQCAALTCLLIVGVSLVRFFLHLGSMINTYIQ